MSKNQSYQQKNDVTDDQETEEIISNTNVTDADTDDEMGLKDDAILKTKKLLLEPNMIPHH